MEIGVRKFISVLVCFCLVVLLVWWVILISVVVCSVSRWLFLIRDLIVSSMCWMFGCIRIGLVGLLGNLVLFSVCDCRWLCVYVRVFW